MNERNIQRIQKHLQSKDAQKRVQQDIQRAREAATVTIGRASELFGFSESQLRDWEIRGLLNPRRSKEGGGQRLYALTELDKLALIKELLDEKYSPNDIPPYIDEIWHSVSSFPQERHSTGEAYRSMSIDHRVEDANKEEFWRYFASQALRMALNLICEDTPEPVAGIVLPLKRKRIATPELDSQELAHLGECLIGWRDQNRSYHTFYAPVPFFDVPSDFRIRGLRALEEQEPKDSTFVVLQRKTKPLSLTSPIVDTIRRLLAPIYEDASEWQSYFDQGMRDVVYPTTSFGSTSDSDSILTSLANMVVRLGGQTADGQNRWKFCCILLPNSTRIPLQLRTLIIQAQSKGSPHTVNKTFVSPDTPILSLSLRAFQGGHIMYRPQVSSEDRTIVYRELEEPIRSAISVPIEGEDGLPMAVLYLVSEELEAFNEEYQRVLRLIGRTIGELLVTSHIRQQGEEKLRDAITRPRVVERTLAGFYSENHFIKDVESLLRTIQERGEQSTDEVTSFISIDIDNQTNFTNMYGDQVSRNLSKALGDRIREQMGLLFGKQTDYKIYYSYADRFYLMLKGTSLERAREIAEKLREALKGNYPVSIMSTSLDQPRNKVELKDITVRLGVTSYKHTKLYEVLQRYPLEARIADVRAGSVLYFLDVALNSGKQKGGNVIVSYYPPEPPEYERSRMELWSPPKERRPAE